MHAKTEKHIKIETGELLSLGNSGDAAVSYVTARLCRAFSAKEGCYTLSYQGGNPIPSCVDLPSTDLLQGQDVCTTRNMVIKSMVQKEGSALCVHKCGCDRQRK